MKTKERVWAVSIHERRPRNFYITAKTLEDVEEIIVLDIGSADCEGLNASIEDWGECLIFDDDGELENHYQETLAENWAADSAYFAGYHDWLDEYTVETFDGRTAVITI